MGQTYTSLQRTECEMAEERRRDIDVTVEESRLLEGMAMAEGCFECRKQGAALRDLWSQVENRAHPTHFAWHCSTCNQNRWLVVD